MRTMLQMTEVPTLQGTPSHGAPPMDAADGTRAPIGLWQAVTKAAATSAAERRRAEVEAAGVVASGDAGVEPEGSVASGDAGVRMVGTSVNGGRVVGSATLSIAIMAAFCFF